MLLAVFVFILGAGAVLGGYAALAYVPGMLQRNKLERRLKDVSAPLGADDADELGLVRRPIAGLLPVIDRLVANMRAGSWLAALIEQAGVRTTPSSIIGMTVAAAIGAAFVAAMFTPAWYARVGAGALAGAFPVAFLSFHRSKRMRAFEEQFPEALDLLSRALRAGHAFQSAMGMVADELKQPVGPEFKKTFDQQNFGLPLRDALVQMSERVPILDVRFFVTSVLIQRDTGGNLSEILDNLAHVVRERFKVKRQVRVHTAHGRFTAFVLLSLPPALAIMLRFINPEHMELLFTDKMGQTMLITVMIMQVIGFIWIRKVIRIEV
jgi:tight adherence protein B